VICTSDEVTALCPVTGQPDFYRVEIDYTPLERCIESKSLKLYLQSFREEGTFGEALAVRIADDLFKALEPARVVVAVIQKPRGGIGIESRATRGGILNLGGGG
jgi:7-cyano-7-deazaguanine reductase